jgi:hypothetical protein
VTDEVHSCGARLSEKSSSNDEQDRKLAASTAAIEASTAAIEAKWTSMVTTLQANHLVEKTSLQGAFLALRWKDLVPILCR